MKSIIDELYFGNLCGYSVKVTEKTEEELKHYTELRETLKDEDLNRLDKYIESLTDRVAEENRLVYRLGFKTGFAFGSELAKEEK